MGYVEKRIRLRKTQYQLMQKLAESRKKTVTMALDPDMEQHAPRQTVTLDCILFVFIDSYRYNNALHAVKSLFL